MAAQGLLVSQKRLNHRVSFSSPWRTVLARLTTRHTVVLQHPIFWATSLDVWPWNFSSRILCSRGGKLLNKLLDQVLEDQNVLGRRIGVRVIQGNGRKLESPIHLPDSSVGDLNKKPPECTGMINSEAAVPSMLEKGPEDRLDNRFSTDCFLGALVEEGLSHCGKPFRVSLENLGRGVLISTTKTCYKVIE